MLDAADTPSQPSDCTAGFESVQHAGRPSRRTAHRDMWTQGCRREVQSLQLSSSEKLKAFEILEDANVALSKVLLEVEMTNRGHHEARLWAGVKRPGTQGQSAPTPAEVRRNVAERGGGCSS